MRCFLKEKKLYSSNQENSNKLSSQIEREIYFSEDIKDFGYISKNIPCQAACPVYTNIPGYIRCIYEKKYGRAYELNRMYNIFPGVLGRICSRPCEAECRHGEEGLGSPVNICHLKRSAAQLKSDWHMIKENFYAPSEKTVSIIGSGPAGLAAAHELTILGHKVTVYEAMEKPGGMLMYGIPEFRLPRNILNIEINNILRLGIDLKTGVKIGKEISIESLLKKNDAVIIATGCQLPSKLHIHGEELEGVYSGLDFVKRVNCGEKIDVGKNVAVVGGGFTAIDCARLAVRLGAENVTVNIRKTKEYMRIDEYEKYEAETEKIKICSLIQPVRINGKLGKVETITFERTRLEYTLDGKGRNAVSIPNSEFKVKVDTVILATGQIPEINFAGMKLNRNKIHTKAGTHKTSIARVYSAGDCVNGATNVITAIAEGRKAAREIDEIFVGRKRVKSVVRFETADANDRKRSFDFIERFEMKTTDVSKRVKDITREVELGYDNDTAHEESKRCYLCNRKFQIDPDRCIYCFACIDVAPRDCIKLVKDIKIKKDGSYGELVETNNWYETVLIAIDSKRCIRCGNCYDICPMKCITITKVELIEQKLEA